MVNAPPGFEEQAPYTIALVKLSEGLVVTAQLTDLGDQAVEIGMPVEMGMSDGWLFTVMLYIPFGRKFRLVMAQ